MTYAPSTGSRLLFVVVALVVSAIFCKAEAADPAVAAGAPGASEPDTVRDAVAFMGTTYGFAIVGVDRLGSEAPDWPSGEQPPVAILRRLLRHYGYIAELATGGQIADGALPRRLIIVAPNNDHADDSGGATSPLPAVLRRDAAARQESPSALTRTLGQLALSTHPSPVPAPPTTAPVAHVTALSGAGAQDASTPAGTGAPDMAALTLAARAGLTGLVSGLRNACKGSGC